MKKPQLMGIVNATPDSFYDGGAYDPIAQAFQLIEAGADLVDIGGESTRPGAEPVTEEEELKRVLPIVDAVSVYATVSIDTMKPEVALKALEHGASLINDVSGFSNPAMIEVAASYQAKVCVMHMQGTPQTMQQNPHYPEGVTTALLRWFERKTEELQRLGIKEEAIILDPGIGFGKSVADNLKIIQNLPKLRGMGYRVLLGLSRKSFMQKLLNQPAEKVLYATLAMNTAGLLNGADIIRVHDVAEHRQTVDMLTHYLNQQKG